MKGSFRVCLCENIFTISHQTGQNWAVSWYAYPVVFSPARYWAHRPHFPQHNPWQKYNFRNQTPCSGAVAGAIIL